MRTSNFLIKIESWSTIIIVTRMTKPAIAKGIFGRREPLRMGFKYSVLLEDAP